MKKTFFSLVLMVSFCATSFAGTIVTCVRNGVTYTTTYTAEIPCGSIEPAAGVTITGCVHTLVSAPSNSSIAPQSVVLTAEQEKAAKNTVKVNCILKDGKLTSADGKIVFGTFRK